MTTSVAAGRPLLDVAVEAVGGSPTTGGHVFVPLPPATACATGVREVVGASLATGRRTRTARELAEADAGLDLLALVARTTGGREAAEVWAIEGWRLLRAHGAGVDLRGANLRGAMLRGARLRGAHLGEADLRGADLVKAELADADLSGADLAGSNLYSASLKSADLTETSLCRADLRNADLRDACCVRTAFRGADLWMAYMWGVDTSQAFTDAADLGRADPLDQKAEQT